MNEQHTHFVILAGGSGERLWPLSRKKMPKQLLSVVSNRTLLDQAIDRATLLTSRLEALWVVTTRSHEESIRRAVGDRVGHIIVEPEMRNTAAAMLYSSSLIQAYDPDATIFFLPADTFIPCSDYPLFVTSSKAALAHAYNHDTIVLFGIIPTYPATGYGYIECDTATLGTLSKVYSVKRFHEKPKRQVAEYYLSMGNMLWNSGMCVGRVATFINACADYEPGLYAEMQTYLKSGRGYDQIRALSFDHAVLEKIEKSMVLPVSFVWYDVGNMGILLSLQDAAASSVVPIQIDARNNLIYAPNKLVALVGVDDLCIVDTPDVLLITKKEQTEAIKTVLYHVKEQGNNEYL